MAFHSPQICLVPDFGLTTSLPFSPLSPFPLSRLQNPTYHVKALLVVCVPARARVCVCVTDSLSFPASPEGQWPVKMSLVTPGTTKP